MILKYLSIKISCCKTIHFAYICGDSLSFQLKSIFIKREKSKKQILNGSCCENLRHELPAYDLRLLHGFYQKLEEQKKVKDDLPIEPKK
jgi:uncharacterized CHY-type Zn-finger protein